MDAAYFAHLKKRIYSISIVVLLVTFVVLQLYLLTNVGTKGQELSEIRQQQSSIKVENEILKAEIMELRSNQSVLNDLQNRSEVVGKSVSVINPDDSNIAAQY